MKNYPERGSPVPSGSAVESAQLLGVPHRLWRLVALARRRLLTLDHDGTLAPLVVARDRATPSPRSLLLLERIATRTPTTVAILSGRPLRELESRFNGVPVHLFGDHGWEHRLVGGEPELGRLPSGARKALDSAEARVRALGLGEALEVKRGGLAFHTRSMPPGAAASTALQVEELWRPLRTRGVLRLTRFDGGVELAVLGRDKGRSLRQVLELEPPGTLAVHVGDDVSDEDAFEAIAGRGFGIRVGAPEGPTSAAGWLDSQAAVEGFLEAWLQTVGGVPGIPAG